MLNKNLLIVCAALVVGLVGVSAMAFERHETANHIKQELAQTQLVLLNTERRLLKMEQQQQQFAQALSEMQAQHAKERGALNHTLAENPDWGAAKLPENIKKAIAK